MADHHYELLEYCVIGNKLHVLYARPTWYVKDGEFATIYEHYIFDKNKKLSNHGQMHLGLGVIKQGINDITDEQAIQKFEDRVKGKGGYPIDYQPEARNWRLK